MFPCVVTPPNEPYCVSELQFCDDVVDCPDGSDEPVDCAQGKYITYNNIITLYELHNEHRVLSWRNTVGQWKRYSWK